MAQSFLSQYFHQYISENHSVLNNFYPGINSRQLLFAYEDFADGDHKVLGDQNFGTERNCDNGKLQQFCFQLSKGIPLAYISRKSHFLDMELFVDSRVLIPRTETEVLVDDLARKIQRENKSVRICEVGTGSGCIAVGLMTETKLALDMVALDISSEALSVAKYNYFKHKFRIHNKSTCQFNVSDRLNAVQDQKFDYIVSNPPYIMESEDRNAVHENVLKHEPHLALFLPDEDYDSWFHYFFAQAHTCLNEGGTLALECSELHIQKLLVLAKKLGFNRVSIENDLTGRERFLIAVKGVIGG